MSPRAEWKGCVGHYASTPLSKTTCSALVNYLLKYIFYHPVSPAGGRIKEGGFLFFDVPISISNDIRVRDCSDILFLLFRFCKLQKKIQRKARLVPVFLRNQNAQINPLLNQNCPQILILILLIKLIKKENKRTNKSCRDNTFCSCFHVFFIEIF